MLRITAIRTVALALSWAVAAVVFCLLLAVLAGCGTSGKAASGGSFSPSAAASSARAAGHAEATPTGGQAAKKAAVQLADDCQPPGGWNDLYPGVTGASLAREAFIRCERIPRGQVPGWAACLTRAYDGAPAGGAPGTPAEDTRQAWLAAEIGRCTVAARGAPASPPATIHPTVTGTGQ